ncbi:membrane protein of unknown function [Magnetospirillum sp. XM-1]|uniref:hypothetical protein n=1 Tax=Magnetospirillum sp. XM-1 TaxID=1663591 RepID=UPI00073DD357|nr:hypothetical protein [Magnetospirillum sp. XM-1]CUW38463.1 membrane protein of unknown function [Magnetospirillum sp. XM-1]
MTPAAFRLAAMIAAACWLACAPPAQAQEKIEVRSPDTSGRPYADQLIEQLRRDVERVEGSLNTCRLGSGATELRAAVCEQKLQNAATTNGNLSFHASDSNVQLALDKLVNIKLGIRATSDDERIFLGESLLVVGTIKNDTPWALRLEHSRTKLIVPSNLFDSHVIAETPPHGGTATPGIILPEAEGWTLDETNLSDGSKTAWRSHLVPPHGSFDIHWRIPGLTVASQLAHLGEFTAFRPVRRDMFTDVTVNAEFVPRPLPGSTASGDPIRVAWPITGSTGVKLELSGLIIFCYAFLGGMLATVARYGFRLNRINVEYARSGLQRARELRRNGMEWIIFTVLAGFMPGIIVALAATTHAASAGLSVRVFDFVGAVAAGMAVQFLIMEFGEPVADKLLGREAWWPRI